MKFSFLKTKSEKQIVALREELSILSEQTKEASAFINEIEKGNFQIDISPKLLQHELGVSLSSMKKHLSKINGEEQIRNWLNTGLATFSDILRNKRSLSLKDLADDILVSLVKYVGANQGAIFVLEGQDKKDEYLQMLSCYAYERKKYLNKRIEIGEGLAGQCLMEKQSIYLKELPTDYVKITSGLGAATPRRVFISPLLINEDVFGVIELATFKDFEPHHIDFINKLSENIAASIKNVKDSERTLALLTASQQQAEELRAQEEEMRQNVEEMQATQEEMKRKSDELNRTSAEMKGVIEGINATMATIEFTAEGIIINANENFLKSVEYPLSDIKGKHHRMFVTKETQLSDDYKTFWTRLASGIPITGIFNRISSSGKTVWLNAIYNPIRDAQGNVVKVIKFATDITEQQEAMAQSNGMLSGINATMATIEFTPDGKIIKANDNFLKTMQYTQSEIVGKHHRLFVRKETLESDEYKTFWTKLAAGESITGIFERVSSSGNSVWLNAIYNPIFNSNHQVIKVVKFATDITATKK
jgi:PAS domain S-box-containing protein